MAWTAISTRNETPPIARGGWLDALRFTPFSALFRPEEGRMGVVVTFLAVLELLREALLELVQAEPFAPIHVRRRG